ncbi:MAG: ammonium transporter, partial [Endomicrobiales bacterium]
MLIRALKYTLLSCLCAAACLAVPLLFAEEPSAPAAIEAAVPAVTDAAPQFTREIADAVSNGKIALDTVWVLFTAFLVFFMNLGFAMVESGLCRSKNAVNILAKNFIVFGISSLAFWILGWGLMFGDGNWFMGLKGLFFVTGADNSPAAGTAYQGVYSALNWTGV